MKYAPRLLWSYLRDRTVAYKLAFGSPAGQEVLADLARFCRANETTFHTDPRLHASLEGRREVWLRIQQHLNMTAHEVYKHATGGSVPPQLEDEDHERNQFPEADQLRQRQQRQQRQQPAEQ